MQQWDVVVYYEGFFFTSAFSPLVFEGLRFYCYSTIHEQELLTANLSYSWYVSRGLGSSLK